MAYICVVDNNFTNSCKIIISKKIIYTALLILRVPDLQAEKILNTIIKYLIDNNYNMKGDLYEDTFFYECANIIVPYLKMIKTDFTIIDPNNKCFCC